MSALRGKRSTQKRGLQIAENARLRPRCSILRSPMQNQLVRSAISVSILKGGLPAEGLEPTRSCDHWILSPARLPIPPRRRWVAERKDTRFTGKLNIPVLESALLIAHYW